MREEDDMQSHISMARRQVAAAVVFFLGTAAHGQTPTPADNAFNSHNEAEAAICSQYGCNNGNGAPAPRVGYDPCYLKQNALRPCNQAPSPVVAENVIGTWELPREGGFWLLDIRGDGTYSFRSEARDGVEPHAGTFTAVNGVWSLKATNGYADGGSYVYQAPDTWIEMGHLGWAAWRRHSLRTASCAR
jgi:hypothetical protein